MVRSRQVPENEAPPVLGHLPARSLTVSAIIGLAPPSSDGDTPGMGGDIQKVSSGSPFEATIGFSRAVRVGDRVLVSGTGPVRPDGSCDSDPTGQARRCFEIVAGYGRSPDKPARTPSAAGRVPRSARTARPDLT